MRKTTAVLIALLLVLCFAGCSEDAAERVEDTAESLNTVDTLGNTAGSSEKTEESSSATESSENSPEPQLENENPETTLAIPLVFDKNGRYTGFDSLPEDYTPDEAVEDGCLVIVGSKDGTTESVLHGGGPRWQKFFEAMISSQDASIRVVLFLDGTPCYTDLFFVNNSYRYFECGGDLTDRPFKYLVTLVGSEGNPPQEHIYYVLTDSLELTYEDVSQNLLSSDLNEDIDIPFVWIEFMSYLSDLRDGDPYAWYTEITPEFLSGKGFAVLKNGATCESVIRVDGGYYPLGDYFGGFGVCDMKYCEVDEIPYLVFTYSFGSGIHRAHVAVFDLNSKETVFTSDTFTFIFIDILLSDGENGVFNVYRAEIDGMGLDFCDLTFKRGDKVAVLTIDSGGIGLEMLVGQYTESELLDMVNEMTQPTEEHPDLQLSSSPFDYIDAHIDTYNKLVEGGQPVAGFFIEQLRQSETFGLDKYIMAVVCSEITGIGNGEDATWATAKEWLELYDDER